MPQSGDNMFTLQKIIDSKNKLVLRTSGLVKSGRQELLASIDDPELSNSAEVFLEFVSRYLLMENVFLKSGETFPYGYWLTKFILAEDGFLHAFEYTKDATEFVPGISLTLRYWIDQHKICDDLQTTFAPIRPDRKVVISEGVLEGDDVEGVRYPSPQHMSGWWMTTDRYDGNIKSLKILHLYHVTSVRPDLARYIALPYGFRFNTRKNLIAYDSDVASRPAR